jgi:nucleotide-binding universal stress UspA family protein
MRIICGTDFSVHADAAAIAAGSLAARLELPVTLAHVIDPSRYVDPSAGLMAYFRRTRQRSLQALAARVGRRGAIVETTIMEGSPAMKLAELARSSSARLLVVSARGQIAPTQWFSGSVTDEVVQTSLIPTLVIRHAGSFESWLQGDRPLKIMIGYDFSASSEAAIRWTASLNAIAPCEITVVYLAPADRERAHLATLARLAPLSYPSAPKRSLEEEIGQTTGPVLGRKARFCVKADWGRPAWQLIELAADNRTDLMVVGTSQRRRLARLGSVARAVLHYFQQNVASVPEGWVSSPSETPLISGDSAPPTSEQNGQTVESDCALVQ